MLGVLRLHQLVKRDSVWPRFPAIVRYQMGAAADPHSLKAPVATYVPITKVIPALELNLTVFFGVKPANAAAGRCPILAATLRTAVISAPFSWFPRRRGA